MIWLGLLLLGCAVADLAGRPAAPRVLPEAVGAATVLLVGALAGQTSALDLLVLVLIAVVVVTWSRSSTRALEGRSGVLPLLVLGAGVLLTLSLSGLASPVGGPVSAWWSGLAWPLADGVGADRALLVLAVMAAQLSTGNVIVRLVLSATGTVNPAVRRAAGPVPDPTDPASDLKGGRLLGPMERILIIGLGLAGNLTAASIVVAAKGLLRFPELSSRKEQEHVHRLTEYFLVGSFVSWLLALTSLALLAA